jgi:NitT/TauT family transport system permease protein
MTVFGLLQNNSFIKKYKNTLIKLGVFTFWILVWEGVYLYVGRTILVVSPLATLVRIKELIITVDFWVAAGGTTFRVVQGVFFAFIFGSALAVITKRFLFAKILFEPVLGILRAIPSASIIILALVWLPTVRIPAFIVFLTISPLIWSSVYEGLGSVDNNLLEMSKIFKWSIWKKSRYIYIPHLAPFMASSLSIAFGQGFKTAISAEVISRPPNSMGRMIYDSRIYLRTLDLFAWTIAVLIISVLIVKATAKLLDFVSNKLAGTTGKEETSP